MTLINDFLSLIYPRHCEACGNSLFRHETFICSHCRLNLPDSGYHRQNENQLTRALLGRVPLQKGLSLYIYEKSGKVQRLLHALKYQDQKELGVFLGKLYGNVLHQSGSLNEIDLIMPIPLHKNKLKARGYNQSECFAKGLAEALSKQMDTVSLERTVETATQTKKRKYQRWENVEGIFKLKDSAAVMNKHVLLVDDVITTGATIEAAWYALKEVEGIKVSIASIAFAAKNN